MNRHEIIEIIADVAEQIDLSSEKEGKYKPFGFFLLRCVIKLVFYRGDFDEKYNFDVCAVDISSLTVFNFLKEGETEEELLERANNYRKENIERWTQLVQEYPDRESFKRYLQKALDSEYQIMSFDEFLKRQRRYYLSLPLREITKEKFEEMFSVLPPLYWCEIDGVEMFVHLKCGLVLIQISLQGWVINTIQRWLIVVIKRHG